MKRWNKSMFRLPVSEDYGNSFERLSSGFTASSEQSDLQELANF